MDNTYIELLIDLHKPNSRQGPGGDGETKRALELAGLDRSCPLKVADLGCGTGASTLVLARELNAAITAVDFLPEFLEELQRRAKKHGVGSSITPLECSIDALPFAHEEFDLIWSEGAIYNMGFESGVEAWAQFLKPGGYLVVSEITWLSPTRPWELHSHWVGEYPEIDVASAKMGILEKHGYTPQGYFVLPFRCWNDNYYVPLQEGFDGFLDRQGGSDQAREIVAREKAEIALYKKYHDYYSYGVYVARKL